MKELKVALVNTQYHGRGYPIGGMENYGLLVLAYAIAGIDIEVGLFPEVGKSTADEERIADFLKGADIPIIGLSVTNSQYTEYRQKLAKLRSQVPDAIFVGGGPAFMREDGKYKDSVDIGLLEDKLDAVNVGHAMPFVEMCYSLRTERLRRTKTGLEGEISTGLYALKDGKIIGQEKGKMPNIPMPVGITNFIFKRILVYADGSCPNACDYCTCPRGSLTPAESTFRQIKKYAQYFSKDHPLISFSDNNPFMTKKSVEFMREIRRRGITTPLSVYADDAMFANPEYMRNLVEELGIESIFIGRETSDAQVAAQLGRRLKGKLRDQDLLDRSIKGLLEFNRQMREKVAIRIGYIVSPFDNPNSIAKLEEETRALSGRNVTHIISPLQAHFGTEIRRKYRDLLIDPDNPWLMNEDTLSWSRESNPYMHTFISGMLAFYALKRKHKNFHQLIPSAKRLAESGKEVEGPVTSSPFEEVQRHCKTLIV